MLGHFKLWAIILILLILSAPFYGSERHIQAVAAQELALMQQALGKSEANEIVRQTNSSYSDIFIDSGIVSSLRSKTSFDSDSMGAGSVVGGTIHRFTTLMSNYLYSAIMMCYIGLLRINILFQWLPFILPFLAAAVIDGVIQNMILNSSVRVSNPVKFKLATHALVLSLALPIVYLFLPFAISPFIILIWALLVALPLMMSISQMSPLTYK